MCKKTTILLGFLAVAILLSVAGCARETRLTQITLQPGAETFLTPNPNVQVHFTAFGTFIHPPAMRDITGEVTWTTDSPQLLTVAGGVVSPTGAGCGVATVTATSNKDTGSSENIVVGNATVTVNDPSDPACPGGSTPSVTLTLLVTGNGTVTSSPAGISCPGTCAAPFPANTSITLTPTPGGGSSFGGWQNCPTTSGSSCIVTLTANESVTATFN
jgi:hypothetical protein